MPRFFVTQDTLSGKFAHLTGEAASHIRVLRLEKGDRLTLCTGDGLEHEGVISDLQPGAVSVVLHSSGDSQSEPKLKCSVYMALAKADKFEHVVQKATELGAAEIIAFPSARCVSRPDERALAKKLERWQKIAVSAAEQSGRGLIPKVLTVSSFEAAVRRACEAELPIVCYENEAHHSLREAVTGAQVSSCALMTGPEGGFTEEEMTFAQSAGMQVCTLGPRILRCETAPLCALTAVLFSAGEYD